MRPRTLYEKLVDSHTICSLDPAGGEVLLYVDRTVLNEYTSPQAFTGLRRAGRRVRRPEAALGIIDHVNPTAPNRGAAMADDQAEAQVAYFRDNCREFGIELLDILHPMQGIEHVVMPELGLVLPGMVIAAGDSHTTTYGAFGALGFGIGTSDIEHYLATQTLAYRRLKPMRVRVDGRLGTGVTAKDLVMALIRRISASGAAGHAVEFDGSAIRALGIEGRMTICNMAVEAGARGAVMAPDETVLRAIEGRPRAPRGDLWRRAVEAWSTLSSDRDAEFARDLAFAANTVEPMVTWGTSPDQAVPVGGAIPDPAHEPDPDRRRDMQRALDYMALRPGMPVAAIRIDRAFIGSCTNARLEDLRQAAHVLRGRRVAPGVRAMVVPGSSSVRLEAEQAGLDRVFIEAGFEWRQPGCSLCLAMNDDVLSAGERCASSSNRNFEGRQGAGGLTHLMSPAMVAAALPAANIDTDVIMPKQFLKGIDAEGLARGVFHHLRFDASGGERPDFVLNRPPWRAAKFLVVGPNFGCGSSREHAVWGLGQLGIRALIGTSFAGIFFDNCARNGLLAIVVAPHCIDGLMSAAADPMRNRFEIDLPNQSIETGSGQSLRFEIEPGRKAALIQGLDAVGATLRRHSEIDAFERGYFKANPWLA